MKFTFYFIQQSILPVKTKKTDFTGRGFLPASGLKIVTEDIVIN